MPIRIPILCMLLFGLSCGPYNESITASKTDLIESVYASALVQPDSLYEVYSAVTGILERQFVEEGDRVEKGEPLFQIFNAAPELNKANAELSLQQAEQDLRGNSSVLEGLEKELQTAQLQFQNDSINFMRQKRLWTQGIGSQTEYDGKKLQFERATNTLLILRNQLERTKTDVETRYRQARNNYRTALVNTKDFIITSKIRGKVYAIHKNMGEIVTVQQPMATIGRSDNFIIELLVDEVDIVRVRKGQEVLISLDAYKDTVFEGRIHKIYPKKDERTQTFLVESLFKGTPKVLYPGLAGEANIIIEKKESVLTLPLEYIVEGDSVITDEGKRKVIIGGKNLERAEILSGVDANTRIYKPGP